jgi:hypothetical protein
MQIIEKIRINFSAIIEEALKTCYMKLLVNKKVCL